MNDSHLFRGMTVNNFKPHFVTGHYVSTPRPMIVSNVAKSGGGWDSDDIISETLGRCTGLKDKNGFLIWEGDICKADIKGEFKNGAICWNRSSFTLGGGEMAYSLADFLANEIEIIGNIYENKNLLEV